MKKNQSNAIKTSIRKTDWEMEMELEKGEMDKDMLQMQTTGIDWRFLDDEDEPIKGWNC